MKKVPKKSRTQRKLGRRSVRAKARSYVTLVILCYGSSNAKCIKQAGLRGLSVKKV